MRYMPKAKSDVHETPDRVWGTILLQYGKTKESLFDPCPVNPQFDGLNITWKRWNYVNPPYSLLKEFVAKAIHESIVFNSKTIMLLPSKTDQQWFHDLLDNGYDMKWIRGRLKFKGAKWSATQPHFLVLID